MTATFDYYTLAHPDAGRRQRVQVQDRPARHAQVHRQQPGDQGGHEPRAIDKAIAKYADTETLYDQPEVDNKKARVTGPFTVEAVPAAAFGQPEVRGIDPIDWDDQKPLPGMEDWPAFSPTRRSLGRA